ncbi:trimethylamine methyltransferase family protein [Tepidibacter sp. Z1-5]|uniref:trimethylamine methyltransferase family protein n=1 Tax=Tepidibacter sp. Z1-5 TaxID=3134138 RepID=UPI0030C5AF5E
MKPVLRFLSDEDLKNVHNMALDMLENMGMQLCSEEAREILKKEGAEVEGEIVKIPRELIARALETVPKRDEFVLYGRTPENDVKISEAPPTLAAMTMATAVIDPDTRERRPATNEDLAKLTKILETLDNVTIASGLVTPQDVPLQASDWYTWATTIKNTTKHITGGVVGKEGVRDAVKMASLAVGSEEEFLKRPFISVWVLTMPPMKVDENTLNVLMEASKYKIPSVISSGGILGISSPITIESAIIHTHAETLACIALSQMVNPGAPVIYSSYVRSMDMKTLSVAMSSPESAIMKSCMAELGLYLDLPTKMPCNLRDSKVLDAQTGFETGMVGTIGALTTDFLVAMQLDMDLVVDYADLPYSNECMSQLQRLVRELNFNEKRIDLDNIEKTGHGGSFLGSKHTVRYFRKELWRGELTERGNYGSWKEEGEKDIAQKSLEKVRQILEETKDVELLDKEIQNKIDAIAEAAIEKSKNIVR